MTLVLRDYQAEAIECLWAAIRDGHKAPLLVEPTGSGKAFLIASICQIILKHEPTARIVQCVHTKELVKQNFQELIGIWNEAPAGIYSSGLKRRDINAQILFAGIQSTYKRAYQVQQCNFLIIDEAHLIPEKSETMYGKFIGDLMTINPDMIIIGLTATDFRLKSGRLVGGENSLFDVVAHETTVKHLVDNGYLCPLTVPNNIEERQLINKAQVDTSNVATRMGEFVQGQLEAAATDQTTVEAICEQIVAHGRNRNGWLIFGAGVKHCEMLVEGLQRRGFAGCGVYGDDKKAMNGIPRDAAINAMKNREYKFLVSHGVLTTGVNIPHVDMIADVGPTKSTSKYVQKYGRGTRTSYDKSLPVETTQQRLNAIANSEKQDCLILDFAGNIARHGPFDDPYVPDGPSGKGQGEAPYKECPNCFLTVATSVRICHDCGHEFPPPETKVHTKVSEKQVMSSEPDWQVVNEVSYSRHAKPGKIPSVKVTYRVGVATEYNEWICPEHDGYARRKFVDFWQRRTSLDIPNNVDETLEAAGELKRPSHILVGRDGKYTTVKNYRFEEAYVEYHPTVEETSSMLDKSPQYEDTIDDEVPF